MVLFVLPGSYTFTQDIDIHGYVSQGFLLSSKNNMFRGTKDGTFQFNELGLNFSSQLSDKLHVGIQFSARDLADTTNDKVVIDWAFADYRFKDYLGFRIGLVKLPNGIFNAIRDLDMLRTCIILPQGHYAENYRESSIASKGINLYGNLPLGGAGALSYDFIYGTLNIPNDGSTAKSTQDRGGLEIQDFYVPRNYFASLIWETPLPNFKISFAYQDITLEGKGVLTQDISISVPFPPFTLNLASKLDPFTVDMDKHVTKNYGIEYSIGNFYICSECRLQDQEVAVAIAGLDPRVSENNTLSYYVLASYRVSDLLEVGAYYNEFFVNRDDKDGTKTPFDPTYDAFRKDLCVSLRFDLSESWLFKLEGHLINGTALLLSQDNLNDEGVAEMEQNWGLFAAKMTFSF